MEIDTIPLAKDSPGSHLQVTLYDDAPSYVESSRPPSDWFSLPAVLPPRNVCSHKLSYKLLHEFTGGHYTNSPPYVNCDDVELACGGRSSICGHLSTSLPHELSFPSDLRSSSNGLVIRALVLSTDEVENHMGRKASVDSKRRIHSQRLGLSWLS